MAKNDDRPIDVGLAALKGKDEPTLVEWWKARFGMIAAIPQEIARAGAMTPQLRELTRIADDAERRKLTRARMIAFGQIPAEQQRLVSEARKKAWERAVRVLGIQRGQQDVRHVGHCNECDASANPCRPCNPCSLKLANSTIEHGCRG